jgi:hypothetical protein
MKLGLFFLAVALTAALAAAFHQWSRRRVLAREHHIRTYVFPGHVLQELSKTYSEFGLKEAQLTARALRQFFLVHARSNNRLIAMPSKAADALWHAFILDTKEYKAFCQSAFGSYFHHIPEYAMKNRSADGGALWRTWRLACLEENINPVKATRLPLLFALDSKLGIPEAVAYDPSSFKPTKTTAGSSSGGCGGAGGDSGDGGGCGGGCGGE